MQPPFEYNEKVRVLPGFGYDVLDGKIGTIKGLVMDLVIVGQIYIVDFNELISDDFPWSSCGIACRFLERVEQ